MKLDIDKERAMFDEVFNTSDLTRGIDVYYVNPETQSQFCGWLAARSAGLSQEPVATLILGGIDGNELEPNDIECNNRAIEALQDKLITTSEPIYLPLYTAQLAPVSAEPIKLSSAVREFLQEAINDATQCEDIDQDHHFAQEIGLLLDPIYSTPPAPAAPLSDAKIEDLASNFFAKFRTQDIQSFARAIEQVHGIGAPLDKTSVHVDNAGIQVDKPADNSDLVDSALVTTAQQWLPIESAPKDGTRVILAWAEKSTVGFFLDNSSTRTPWSGWRVPSMEHAPIGQPTHWMPLPQPPATTKTETQDLIAGHWTTGKDWKK